MMNLKCLKPIYAQKEHLRKQERLKVLFETQLVVYFMLFL